jgi:hypothetical protein
MSGLSPSSAPPSDPAAASWLRGGPLEVDVQRLLDAIVSAAVGNGLAPEGMSDFVTERACKPMVVVAAAPKTGSTYLVNTLRRLTGLRGFRLCAAYATNEHDLYLPALCLTHRYGCVSQLHMKGTFHNAALMSTFGIRPIILVRRIEDIVVSLQYSLRGKTRREDFESGRTGYSFVWLDECTKALSDERLLDMIIDLAVPWFINFYVSWYRLCEQGAVDAMWVTYEELVADKEKTIREVLDFLGLRDSGALDPAVLEHRYHTFRDGRVGHGASTLTAQQRERLCAQFSYYPDIDFGRYGV